MGSQYSAVAAKLKAMRGECLKPEDYEQMLGMRSVREVCAYLKQNTGYGEVLEGYSEEKSHRGEIEHRLLSKLFDEYSRLYIFMNQDQREFLSLWMRRWEIRLLQRALRYIRNHEAAPPPEQWLGAEVSEREIRKHSKIDLDALAKAKTMSEIADACGDSAYKEIIQTGERLKLDLFAMGMRLDRYYLETLWKASRALPKEDAEAFGLWMGTDLDMLNVMWIYRAKRFWGFSNQMIYTTMIPIRRRLSPADIENMVNSADTDAMRAYVAAKTPYGAIFDNYDEGVFIEENYNTLSEDNSRRILSTHPQTMAAVYAYIKLKEVEISNLTVIIEGIRYGMNSENIKKHLMTGGGSA